MKLKLKLGFWDLYIQHISLHDQLHYEMKYSSHLILVLWFNAVEKFSRQKCYMSVDMSYTRIGANVHDRHTTYDRRRTIILNEILNCTNFQRTLFYQSLYQNSYLQVNKMFFLTATSIWLCLYSNPTYNKAPFLLIALDMGHSKFL